MSNFEKVLYIFRHGETDWNRAGRFQGGTDIPLNEEGRKQAQGLAAFFEQHPVEIFLSSDLNRAYETARMAAARLQVSIETDVRLRETNLGDAEGLTYEEIDVRFGPGTLETWRSSNADEPERSLHFRFPNGESKAEHLARTLSALEDFLETRPYRTIGVASHGGAMRRLIHHMRPGLADPVMVQNCVIYRFTYQPGARIWRVDHEPALAGSD